MNKAELVVIINSFNRLGLLKKSLDSLVKELNKTNINYAAVIFDAGSTDGSVEWIQSFASACSATVKLVRTLDNEDSPFSYGVNAACKHALMNFESVKYFLLYETDNYLKSAEVIMHSKHLLDQENNIAACGYTVKKYNGSKAGFGSSFPSLMSFALGKQFSFFFKLEKPEINWMKKDFCEFSYCDVVYTSPLLIKAKIWEELDGFDHVNFPFSDCDIDLSYRIYKLNKKIAVIKTSDIIHDNLQTPSLWSDTRTVMEYRARFIYFRKYYGNIVHLIKPFLFITHIMEFLILSVLTIFGKRKIRSLRMRWFLIRKVFVNYNSSES